MNDKTNIDKLYYPILIPDPNETKEDMLSRWDIFDTLPEDIQYKLSDKKIANEIRNISDMFSLKPGQIASVSRSIRRYYFREIDTKDISHVISEESGISSETAERISELLLENIIDAGVLEERSKLAPMTISEALNRYPGVGEQMITSMPLDMKSFPQPVRPSISNWISDYTFNVGFNNKDTIARGNYLFHSKSTELLSDTERDRLSQILKSLDENTPVLVDETRGIVVFSRPQIKEQKTQSPVPQQAAVKPARENAATENDASERLSSWRKNLNFDRIVRKGGEEMELPRSAEYATDSTKNPASPTDANMRFSSPHRLPIEKNVPKIQTNSIFSKTSPEPAKNPANAPVDLSNVKIKPFAQDAPSIKNIVNLKEE